MSLVRTDVCPICDGDCQEALSMVGDYEEIICDECQQYRITGTARKMIVDLPYHRRMQALWNARDAVAKPGQIPMIGSREVEDVT